MPNPTESDLSFTEQMCAEGYVLPIKLPTGEWAALNQFMFTVGLVVGLDPYGYRCRYCYESGREATQALLLWNGEGDPTGPWIKHKGKTREGKVVDRDNPRLTNATALLD